VASTGWASVLLDVLGVAVLALTVVVVVLWRTVFDRARPRWEVDRRSGLAGNADDVEVDDRPDDGTPHPGDPVTWYP
jgi:hypothetical protein